MEHPALRHAPEPSDSARSLFGDQLPMMRDYADLLADTGVDHGLIGPREVPRLWERHLLNCGVLAELMPTGARVADVGSGAGLPGLVLAIARPDLHLTLVEPLQRRVTWLENTVAQLALSNVEVWRERAEYLVDLSVDVVTSRAVAALPKLARWSFPLVREGGIMVALKGASAATELADAAAVLTGLGARSSDVVLCGVGVIDPPATVVRVVMGARPGRRTRRPSSAAGPRGANR